MQKILDYLTKCYAIRYPIIIDNTIITFNKGFGEITKRKNQKHEAVFFGVIVYDDSILMLTDILSEVELNSLSKKDLPLDDLSKIVTSRLEFLSLYQELIIRHLKKVDIPWLLSATSENFVTCYYEDRYGLCSKEQINLLNRSFSINRDKQYSDSILIEAIEERIGVSFIWLKKK